MSTKVSYSFSMGDNAIEAAIGALEKRTATLNADVQKVAVSILAGFKKSGDKPTAVRRANALHKALGKGLRGNAMLMWFEQHAPMVFNKETKALVAGFTAMSPCKDHTKIDLAAATGCMWHDADGGEKPYQALADWSAELNKLIKRGREDIAKMGDKSKVKADDLLALERLAKGLDAKGEPAY